MNIIALLGVLNVMKGIWILICARIGPLKNEKSKLKDPYFINF